MSHEVQDMSELDNERNFKLFCINIEEFNSTCLLCLCKFDKLNFI